MDIKVSPTLPEHIRTHHASLTDRNGKSIGLILVDDNGDPRPMFTRNPVDRTSFKTTSGSMAYSDFEYPYTPIAQDNWTGGRGSLNFEADVTRFIDSYRLRTSRANKIFLGPQEQYTYGYGSLSQDTPGHVSFFAINGDNSQIAVRAHTDANITGSSVVIWLMLKRVGSPEDLTIKIKDDNSGDPGSLVGSQTVVEAADLDDTISRWVLITYEATLSPSTYYWIELTSNAGDNTLNHWEAGFSVGVGFTQSWQNSGGGSWDGMNVSLYYRLTPVVVAKNPVFFTYDQQKYLVTSEATGAPKLYMNGDRGVADSNSGSLDKLIDATKSWTPDTLIGAVCLIITGAGCTEERPYRIIEDNTANQLIFTSDPWLVEHDTTTEYVIIGSDLWYEMIGHGMTAPVTDVLVSTNGVVYFAQGDSVAIRRHRTWNDSGTWTNDWDDDGTNKATHFVYAQQAKKIWKSNNVDANNVPSVASADVPVWGANLSFATATQIGSKFERINELAIYLDEDKLEAVFVGKEGRPWIVPSEGNPHPISLSEMENIRSAKNCKVLATHDVYLYFSMLNGIEQYYYDGNLKDTGPNLDEGLPEGRQGPIVSFLGHPGKYFLAIDGGDDGYSSVMLNDGGGWHEHYRAPLGQRIKAIDYQVVTGGTLNRLWIYQGNDIIWLPFPTETLNELEDSNYLYTHEGVIELSRMHAGMMDVLKLVKLLKIMSDDLVENEQWIEVDYRVDNETEWTAFPEEFYESPLQEVSLADAGQEQVTFGVAGKRLMLRLRFYTTNANKTPVLLALVLEVVSRITVKHLYALPCRIVDNDRDLQGNPDDMTAEEKFALLDEWISDAAVSMLLMRSIEPGYDKKLVFLQPYADRTRTLAKTPEETQYQSKGYIVTLVAQDA